MPRPRKHRLVNRPPCCASFKPTGVPRAQLDTVILSLEEYEAIRLADYRGLEHLAAAQLMEVSRPTFTRLLEQARKKTGRFLIEGTELQIEGGTFHFQQNLYQCTGCGTTFEVDMGVIAEQCPSCGDTRLTDLAGQFGHGNCCRLHRRQRHGHGKNRRK